jgi:hypothetical protein
MAISLSFLTAPRRGFDGNTLTGGPSVVHKLARVPGQRFERTLRGKNWGKYG